MQVSLQNIDCNIFRPPARWLSSHFSQRLNGYMLGEYYRQPNAASGSITMTFFYVSKQRKVEGNEINFKLTKNNSFSALALKGRHFTYNMNETAECRIEKVVDFLNFTK